MDNNFVSLISEIFESLKLRIVIVIKNKTTVLITVENEEAVTVNPTSSESVIEGVTTLLILRKKYDAVLVTYPTLPTQPYYPWWQIPERHMDPYITCYANNVTCDECGDFVRDISPTTDISKTYEG